MLTNGVGMNLKETAEKKKRHASPHRRRTRKTVREQLFFSLIFAALNRKAPYLTHIILFFFPL